MPILSNCSDLSSNLLEELCRLNNFTDSEMESDVDDIENELTSNEEYCEELISDSSDSSDSEEEVYPADNENIVVCNNIVVRKNLIYSDEEFSESEDDAEDECSSFDKVDLFDDWQEISLEELPDKYKFKTT